MPDYTHTNSTKRGTHTRAHPSDIRYTMCMTLSINRKPQQMHR